jgi:hypothetical protein
MKLSLAGFFYFPDGEEAKKDAGVALLDALRRQ